MQEGEHIMEQNQNFVLDDDLTISEKCRYGYSYNPMIPLTTKQAKLLYKKGLVINVLYPDGMNITIDDFNAIESERKEVLFSIEKDVWMKYISNENHSKYKNWGK